MKNTIEAFEKKKNYLICVDSDGCAMDTMDIKHIRCFGPCIIEEWDLLEWKEEILKRWNVINLYSMTRGINRFKGLALMLEEINTKYTKIEDIELFVKWEQEADELSNGSVEREFQRTGSIIFKKALAWSKAVNQAINALEDSVKVPFAMALEGLKVAHTVADVAIVSSANLQAVLEEWEEHHLLEHTDVVCAQNVGSKAYCIAKLLEKGYEKEQVIMIGDAPGDYDAAKKNDVFYYPILVGKEKESWERLIDEGINQFITHQFDGEYQNKLVAEFIDNLSK